MYFHAAAYVAWGQYSAGVKSTSYRAYVTGGASCKQAVDFYDPSAHTWTASPIDLTAGRHTHVMVCWTVPKGSTESDDV